VVCRCLGFRPGAPQALMAPDDASHGSLAASVSP
jgi:hypothetical protein